MVSSTKKLQVMWKFIADYTNLWPVLKPSKVENIKLSAMVARQTFPSHTAAWMTVASMLRPKQHVVAKLKTKNKSVSAFFKQAGSSDGSNL